MTYNISLNSEFACQPPSAATRAPALRSTEPPFQSNYGETGAFCAPPCWDAPPPCWHLRCSPVQRADVHGGARDYVPPKHRLTARCRQHGRNERWHHPHHRQQPDRDGPKHLCDGRSDGTTIGVEVPVIPGVAGSQLQPRATCQRRRTQQHLGIGGREGALCPVQTHLPGRAGVTGHRRAKGRPQPEKRDAGRPASWPKHAGWRPSARHGEQA